MKVEMDEAEKKIQKDLDKVSALKEQSDYIG